MKTRLAALLLATSTALAAPVTVPTERGPLTLPNTTKRVIPLEYSFLDTLIALGVRPPAAAIGTQGGDRGVPAYLRSRLGGVREIGSRAQPNLELMLASNPDVILADAFVHKDLLGRFGSIAPTAAFQSRRGSYDDIMNQVVSIGRIVGKEAVAKQLLADQAALVQKARAFANPKAPAVVMAVVTEKSVTVHTNDSFVGSLLEKLGRKNAVKPQNGATQYEISLEGLAALNPQTLVLFTAPDETPLTREWAKNPLWSKLNAVSRGRVFNFDRDLWTRARGPIALKLMLAQSIESGLLADKAPKAAFVLAK